MRRKNDILWKVVLEEVFDDLLRFLYPDADRAYDMERGFEFLEKELAELHPGAGEAIGYPIRRQVGEGLPSAVAIFIGRNGQMMPDRFEYAYRSTSLVFRYHAVSILDFSDAELEASSNPFALVVMVAKIASLVNVKVGVVERIKKSMKTS